MTDRRAQSYRALSLFRMVSHGSTSTGSVQPSPYRQGRAALSKTTTHHHFELSPSLRALLRVAVSSSRYLAARTDEKVWETTIRDGLCMVSCRASLVTRYQRQLQLRL